MKNIPLNTELQINQQGNRSDLFGKEISDLFSSNHEKLHQLIDLGLKEHIDVLPSWYEYILQGIVYYFFTNKELFSDITKGESGYEWQRFQESFKSHYRYQPKHEDIRQSLYPFAQRIVGWWAKTVFKSTANSKYDELFGSEPATNRDEEKLDEITLGLVSNYIAQELARTLQMSNETASKNSTNTVKQLEIAKSIVSRYKQEAKLHKLIQMQVEQARNSIFNVTPIVEQVEGGDIFGIGQSGSEWRSKKDYFSFFEHYVDLAHLPALLTDQHFYSQHPSFKKIIADYNNESVKFGFGLDEKKAAAGAVLRPKVTKTMSRISEKFDLKDKLFPVDEIQFIRYGDNGENIHLQKTGKRVKSSKPEGYTQLISKIIPQKNLIDVVVSFQQMMQDYQFKSVNTTSNQPILASNNLYDITKHGTYPYYIGLDKKTGEQLVFVSLSNNLKKEYSKGDFFAPLGSFGEFGYQPISVFQNDVDEFYRTEIQQYMNNYAVKNKLEFDKNELEFIKNSLIIWFVGQPKIGNPNKDTINNVLQIYRSVFAQSVKSQIIDGNVIDPVYDFEYLGKKTTPTESEMFNFIGKDLSTDNKLTEKNVLKETNLQHLFHFSLSNNQKNQLAEYINHLIETDSATVEHSTLVKLSNEFEKESVLSTVEKISEHRDRIIISIRNIRVAQHNKDALIESKLIGLIKKSSHELIDEIEKDITKMLDLCQNFEDLPKSEENTNAIRDFMLQVNENYAHISLLRYFIDLPDQERDLEGVKKGVIQLTTFERKTSWETKDNTVMHGTEQDSLFNDGAGYEIALTDHIFGPIKPHTQYSGGSKTILDKFSYNPSSAKNQLELSPKLQTKPSDLRHADNDTPLPLCELPQIKDFINHYLAFRRNNSSLNNIKLLQKNENLLRQWLLYFISNSKYLITYLNYIQEHHLYSGKDNPVTFWLSNIIANSPNPHNFEQIEEHMNYTIDTEQTAQIFYHLGYIEKGQGTLQKLGEKCLYVPDFDALEPELIRPLDTIQPRVNTFIQEGFVDKKLVSI